jgi:hypothetical protein
MAPGVRELLVLAALAAFGCGLALALGDFLFAAIFGAANAVATIDTTFTLSDRFLCRVRETSPCRSAPFVRLARSNRQLAAPIGSLWTRRSLAPRDV